MPDDMSKPTVQFDEVPKEGFRPIVHSTPPRQIEVDSPIVASQDDVTEQKGYLDLQDLQEGNREVVAHK